MSDDIKARIEKLIGEAPKHFKEFGRILEVENVSQDWHIWRMRLIERLAKDAQIAKDSKYSWLTLDIQPIKRGVTKSEIVEMLRTPVVFESNGVFTFQPLQHLADRIEREGVRDD